MGISGWLPSVDYRSPLKIHFLFRPAAKAAYSVAIGGHIFTNMTFSCALSFSFIKRKVFNVFNIVSYIPLCLRLPRSVS